MCVKCGTSEKSGNRGYCKECQRVYISAYRQVVRDYINEVKKSPCVDCGKQYPPYVMQFDHRDPTQKLFNIGNNNRTLALTMAEIAKCDLVCANCHAERTWGQ